MNKIIDKHWHFIGKCINKDAFPEKPLITYKRNKNLSGKLVKVRCGQIDRTEQTARILDNRCNNPWLCQFCQKPSHSHIYKSTVTGREYKGPATYTCKSENVIYLITCKKCKKQYVGETYREFNMRMKEHLTYIRNPHQYDEPTGGTLEPTWTQHI